MAAHPNCSENTSYETRKSLHKKKKNGGWFEAKVRSYRLSPWTAAGLPYL